MSDELTADQIAYCHGLAESRRAEWLRHSVIEECAKIAEERAAKLRAKAKAQNGPSKQSFFAQAIEARVIADLIRRLSPVAH